MFRLMLHYSTAVALADTVTSNWLANRYCWLLRIVHFILTAVATTFVSLVRKSLVVLIR
jgi:hypothetical protein